MFCATLSTLSICRGVHTDITRDSFPPLLFAGLLDSGRGRSQWSLCAGHICGSSVWPFLCRNLSVSAGAKNIFVDFIYFSICTRYATTVKCIGFVGNWIQKLTLTKLN